MSAPLQMASSGRWPSYRTGGGWCSASANTMIVIGNLQSNSGTPWSTSPAWSLLRYSTSWQIRRAAGSSMTLTRFSGSSCFASSSRLRIASSGISTLTGAFFAKTKRAHRIASWETRWTTEEDSTISQSPPTSFSATSTSSSCSILATRNPGSTSSKVCSPSLRS